MGKIYDAEDLCDEIKSLLVSKLNDEICLINTEKDDGIELSSIDEDAYYFQTWNNKILNDKIAIFYGLQEPESDGIGPYTATTYKIFIEILMLDIGQDDTTARRVMRYCEALKRVLQKSWDKLTGSSRLKIAVSIPLAFKDDENSSNEYKIGGILVTTSFQ